MNKTELQIAMLREEKSVDDLCAALGISRSSWFRKVGGDSQFTQGEIMALRFELQLSDQQTTRIFFDDKVS